MSPVYCVTYVSLLTGSASFYAAYGLALQLSFSTFLTEFLTEIRGTHFDCPRGGNSVLLLLLVLLRHIRG